MKYVGQIQLQCMKSIKFSAKYLGKMSSKRKLSRMMGGSDSSSLSTSAWGQSDSGLPMEMLSPDASRKSNPTLASMDKDSVSSSPITTQDTDETKIFPFKDANFVHSSKGQTEGRRQRAWKSLKQIVAIEKSLPWQPDDVTYGSIEAPPSFKPAKKYSDLSGLPAKYTDPHTKIRYATSDEFARLRVLPSDIIAGHLTLRKDTPIVS